MEINFTAIYILWLREIKRFLRSWPRVVSMVMMPIFLLIFLSFGFKGILIPGVGESKEYIHFLVPGILGMSLMFSSLMVGISILWDREFGFLKEILVAPVNRISIIAGRIIGGMTTSLLQAILILLISLGIGFKTSFFPNFILAFLVMILISLSFVGFGIILALIVKDIQGFGLIIQLIIMPLFFLSGILFPISNLPFFLRYLSFFNPLTYGVEGLRMTLIGVSYLPLWAIFLILTSFSILMVILGSYLFEKTEQ